MFPRRLVLLVLAGLVATAFAEPSRGRGGSRGGGHSYPRSHGYSGSGASRTHSYTQSTGLSGSTNHIQQTSYGHYQHNSYQQPQQNTNQYHQQSTYHHQQPSYHNQQTSHQQQNNYNYAHKTEVHNHYHYNPPQKIVYGSTYLPVYRAAPPVYVYEYRDSGSRFDTLLTGLALYNLGRMSERHSNYDVHREYRSNPGEICKLGINKQNGEYEETRIDCKLMSSFIWESGTQSQSINTVNQASTNTITKTVVETTNSKEIGVGTGSENTKVTTTVTVVDALQAKGPSIPVTTGMQCFMIHMSRDTTTLKKPVDCALLQTYAQRSLYRNDSVRLVPSLVILVLFSYSFWIF